MLRTHTCGEIRKSHIGKKVKLCGWINTIRNHGKVWFIDLRDRYGKIQVVFVESENKELNKSLKELTQESCIKVEGEVVARKKGTENKKLETGDIEVLGKNLEVFVK